MTVGDAETKLYTWFLTNHSVRIDKDLLKIIGVSDDLERDSAAMKLALTNFEGYKLITKTSIKDSEIWILNKSLFLMPQTVELSPLAALAMTELLNEFGRLSGSKDDICNAAEIKSKDIENIISMAKSLFDSAKEVDEEKN